MSASDDIFFRTSLPPLKAAQRLSDLLALTLRTGVPGEPIVVGQVPGSTAYSGGSVSTNYLANEPGEPSILDHYDIIWSIRSTDRLAETVHEESRRLFALAITKVAWPALLMYGSSASLVAVWSPKGGRHDFPERTAYDSAGMELWLPFIPS